MNKITIKKIIISLIAIDIIILSIIFSVSGVYNDKVDTGIYVSQINQFKQGSFSLENSKAALRFFKPFYGVVGSWFVLLLSPYAFILFINIFFLSALTILSFFLFKEIIADDRLAFWGAIWAASGYPMLKYGLALGTDISGWFFAVATVLAVLIGARQSKMRYFILASLLGFLGALTKESGILGLVFGGAYVLAHIGVWNFKKIVKTMARLSIPFLALEGLFLFLMSKTGLPTFFDWYALNLSSYAREYYKLFYFIGTELSSFHIILFFGLLGIYHAIKRKDVLNREWLAIFFGLFAASLPVLAWPIFISRILYIQFLFFIPLALYGIYHFSFSGADKKILGLKLSDYMLLAPVIISVTLFFLSGTGSLFEVLKSLLD